MVARGQAKWLGIGNLAQFARYTRVDDALLILEDTYLEALILWLEEDLMPVKAVECLSCILTG